MNQKQTFHISMRTFRFPIWLVVVCLGGAVFGNVADAQDARKEFDKQIEEWRKTILETREAGLRYFQAEREDSYEIKERYEELTAKGKQQLEDLIPLALQAFEESPKPDKPLDDFVSRIQDEYFVEGLFDKSYELGKKILARAPQHQIANIVTARAAVVSNHFDHAKAYAMKNTDMIKKMPLTEKNLFGQVQSLETKFQRELKLREAEAKADDLPRVQIKTTKGTIIVELFENEAPDTVGNFISLVEAKFYDDSIFHRVIYQFMAQGGGYSETKEKSPGYMIYDECHKPEIRHHFRGVLSMAKTPEPNTGNSQFFINTIPTPFLDGAHTVFGRVIEGMEAVDRFNHTFENDEEEGEVLIQGAVPDKIISAKVIRKRDHEYKPNMVKN